MTNDLIEAESVSQMPAADGALVATITKAEIDTLISTARAYPRSIRRALDQMKTLATLTPEAADEAIYSLPRGGKTIEGPSIRFAEMAVQSWGNARVAARTTMIDKADKFVEAEGFFLDAETNVATLARIRRRIVDKYGKVFNDDMILMTCNAAQSIARRNAILAGIPKSVWSTAYMAARAVVMGDLQTLGNRRAEAVKAFQRFGLSEAQVLQIMGLKGIEDVGLEQIVPLRGMYSALLNSETTVEELLRSIEPEKPTRQGAATASMAAPQIFQTAAMPADAKAPVPQAAAEAPQQPAEAKQEAPAADAEPDDRDIIAHDIIAQVRACGGNQAALKRVVANAQQDLAALDQPRREKVQAEIEKHQAKNAA